MAGSQEHKLCNDSPLTVSGEGLFQREPQEAIGGLQVLSLHIFKEPKPYLDVQGSIAVEKLAKKKFVYRNRAAW